MLIAGALLMALAGDVLPATGRFLMLVVAATFSVLCPSDYPGFLTAKRAKDAKKTKKARGRAVGSEERTGKN
jgi:hypothetical protein